MFDHTRRHEITLNRDVSNDSFQSFMCKTFPSSSSLDPAPSRVFPQIHSAQKDA